MRKENPMETAVRTEQAAPDRSVFDAVIAAREKIATRLDALKEYVLSYMDVESLRDAWDLEAPPQDMLEEAEQILSDLREIDSYAGLEEAVAEGKKAGVAA